MKTKNDELVLISAKILKDQKNKIREIAFHENISEAEVIRRLLEIALEGKKI